MPVSSKNIKESLTNLKKECDVLIQKNEVDFKITRIEYLTNKIDPLMPILIDELCTGLTAASESPDVLRAYMIFISSAEFNDLLETAEDILMAIDNASPEDSNQPDFNKTLEKLNFAINLINFIREILEKNTKIISQLNDIPDCINALDSSWMLVSNYGNLAQTELFKKFYHAYNAVINKIFSQIAMPVDLIDVYRDFENSLSENLNPAKNLVYFKNLMSAFHNALHVSSKLNLKMLQYLDVKNSDPVKLLNNFSQSFPSNSYGSLLALYGKILSNINKITLETAGLKLIQTKAIQTIQDEIDSAKNIFHLLKISKEISAIVKSNNPSLNHDLELAKNDLEKIPLNLSTKIEEDSIPESVILKNCLLDLTSKIIQSQPKNNETHSYHQTS